MNYLTVLVWCNSSLFCTEQNLFRLIVCFMRTKTVCLKMHLNYATAFLKIPFKSYNYAVKLVPSQWTPTSLSWLHSGSPCMDLGTQFKTLVSPDMQFSLSRKMGPDPTPKLSDARRNCTPTHWFDIKQVTLFVERLAMYIRYLVGLVKKVLLFICNSLV